MNILISNGIIVPMSASKGDKLYFKGYVGIEGERVSFVSADESKAKEFAEGHPDAKRIRFASG